MGVSQNCAFLALALVFLSSSSVSGLDCNMCNSLMGKVVSACPTADEYHAMGCTGPNTADYCMRVDGTYTASNTQEPNKPPVTPTVIGIQRDCGTPAKITQYLGTTFTGDSFCQDVMRTDVDIIEQANADGSFPKMSFEGRVCFCKGDACNDDRCLEESCTTLAPVLKCNMCNTLMGPDGFVSACPDNTQYHAMGCSGANTAEYCMRLDGAYTASNVQEPNKPPATPTVTGVQRYCGSSYNINLFYGQPMTGDRFCTTVKRENVDLTAKPNADGSYPKMSYEGQVCFCKGDSCNDDRCLGDDGCSTTTQSTSPPSDACYTTPTTAVLVFSMLVGIIAYLAR